MILRSPISTLFPYTTLFRSSRLLSDTRVIVFAFASGIDFLCRIPGRAACHRFGRVFRTESYVFLWRITRDSPARHGPRSEEHTSELQSLTNLVCRLLLEKKT